MKTKRFLFVMTRYSLNKLQIENIGFYSP